MVGVPCEPFVLIHPVLSVRPARSRVGQTGQCYQELLPDLTRLRLYSLEQSSSGRRASHGSAGNRITDRGTSMAKRDRYVARGVSLAPIVAVARARRPPDRRRRPRVHRLRRRHRRAQPAATRRTRSWPRSRSRPRRCCTRASRWPRTSRTSRSAGCSVEHSLGDFDKKAAADQLGRRGRRERRQDRPLPHRPRRRDHVRPRASTAARC